MAWVLVGGAATVGLVLLAITNPAIAISFAVGALALVWVVRQGWWRAMYVMLLIFTLGATSTIEYWNSISTYGRAVAMAALIAATFWTTRGGDHGRLRGIQSWVIFPLYAIASIAILSAVWSPAGLITLQQAAMLTGLVVLLHLLIVRRWTDRSALVGDLRAGFLVASVVLAVGLLAGLAGLLPPTFTGRFQGLLNNPNMAAQVAVLVFFLGLALFLETGKWWWLCWLIPSALTVLLAQSRTATLAIGCGLVWVMLRAGVKGLVALVAATLVGVLVVLTSGPGLLGSVIDRFGDTDGGDVFSGRLLAWDNTIAMINARPWGYGWGVTDVVLTSAYQSGASQVGFVSVHHSFLQIALEIGLLGLALLVVALASTIVLLVVHHPKRIEIGLSGLIVAGVVVMFAESSVFGTGQTFPYFFWFAVAGVLTISTNSPAPTAQQLVTDGLARKF